MAVLTSKPLSHSSASIWKGFFNSFRNSFFCLPEDLIIPVTRRVNGYTTDRRERFTRFVGKYVTGIRKRFRP